MKVFLILLVVMGAWNLLSFIARLICNEPSYRYVSHIVIGSFAAYFLLQDIN